MILTTLLLAVWLVMDRYPETPAGRLLRRWCVERPAARLARISRGHVILLFLFVAATAGLVWLVGEESARLIGTAAPEVIGWASSFEMVSLVDAVFTAVLAGGMLRFGRIAAHLRAWRPRARRIKARATRQDDAEGRRPTPRHFHARRGVPARLARRRAPGRFVAVARRR